MRFNIKKFLAKFNQEYDFLYKNKDMVCGYNEAVAEFDKLIKSNNSFKNFVSAFCTYRNDLITSDREAAAFMFTLESME